MARKRFSVYGLKWRDTSGNTYHVAIVEDHLKNVSFKSKLTYGYDTQYRQTAQALLKAKGYRVKLTSLNSTFDSQYVSKKKDLGL